MVTAPSRNGDNEPAAARGSNGRFLKGNPGGPGNPNAAKVVAHKRAVLDAVTPADIRRIMRKMVWRALRGDVRAAQLVLDYTVGPAKQRTQLRAYPVARPPSGVRPVKDAQPRAAVPHVAGYSDRPLARTAPGQSEC